MSVDSFIVHGFFAGVQIGFQLARTPLRVLRAGTYDAGNITMTGAQVPSLLYDDDAQVASKTCRARVRRAHVGRPVARPIEPRHGCAPRLRRALPDPRHGSCPRKARRGKPMWRIYALRGGAERTA